MRPNEYLQGQTRFALTLDEPRPEFRSRRVCPRIHKRLLGVMFCHPRSLMEAACKPRGRQTEAIAHIVAFLLFNIRDSEYAYAEVIQTRHYFCGLWVFKGRVDITVREVISEIADASKVCVFLLRH